MTYTPTVQFIAVPGDLPEVHVNEYGTYSAGTATHGPGTATDINDRVLNLMAIKLRMEADAKAAMARSTVETAEIIRANTKAAEEAAARKAHDDLRTSPIALKALAIYNKSRINLADYTTWGATNGGEGSSDSLVYYYIGRAEAEEAREKEAAEKLAARRDALAKELCDGTSIGPWYEAMGTVHKRAIDRIIALEAKAA